MGGTATIEPGPQWVRLEHKNGGFAGSYDWERRIIMFVNRGGTVYYDLADIENGMRRRVVVLND